MSGFGVQTKNINELIKKIEKEIAYIQANLNKDVTILTNKLSICTSDLLKLKTECDELKTYSHEEYEYLNEKTRNLELQIDDIRSRLNTIQYKGDFIEKCASGINEFPIYAKYADKDINGNSISTTYAKQTQVNTIQENLNTLSGIVVNVKKDCVKHKGDICYSAVSSLNPEENDVYRITGVEGWKERIPNKSGHVSLLVGNEDHIIFNGSYWKKFADNTQTSAITQEFIDNLHWEV
jgi:hypothetical protein